MTELESRIKELKESIKQRKANHKYRVYWDDKLDKELKLLEMIEEHCKEKGK